MRPSSPHTHSSHEHSQESASLQQEIHTTQKTETKSLNVLYKELTLLLLSHFSLFYCLELKCHQSILWSSQVYIPDVRMTDSCDEHTKVKFHRCMFLLKNYINQCEKAGFSQTSLSCRCRHPIVSFHVAILNKKN